MPGHMHDPAHVDPRLEDEALLRVDPQRLPERGPGVCCKVDAATTPTNPAKVETWCMMRIPMETLVGGRASSPGHAFACGPACSCGPACACGPGPFRLQGVEGAESLQGLGLQGVQDILEGAHGLQGLGVLGLQVVQGETARGLVVRAAAPELEAALVAQAPGPALHVAPAAVERTEIIRGPERGLLHLQGAPPVSVSGNCCREVTSPGAAPCAAPRL
eukprot:CAMPEP_0168425848 /NCGR_PEP_ID=MMETSP0228-20121227/35532_1 /TAXON_ID=133427 /ORGANISM="Protoceratium reticulatum, Strain CCCM 535 (=CCMP 1889)" /LENGTH=217 /DNA_ID=CAMNT_0008439847 /DNA_START=250 /DNA_END=906 /DNA_ORIENTATION=-